MQRAPREWRGPRRKVSEDKEAGGWADGRSRIHTHTGQQTTAWGSE